MLRGYVRRDKLPRFQDKAGLFLSRAPGARSLPCLTPTVTAATSSAMVMMPVVTGRRLGYFFSPYPCPLGDPCPGGLSSPHPAAQSMSATEPGDAKGLDESVALVI
jgi:hypothetical protein